MDIEENKIRSHSMQLYMNGDPVEIVVQNSDIDGLKYSRRKSLGWFYTKKRRLNSSDEWLLNEGHLSDDEKRYWSGIDRLFDDHSLNIVKFSYSISGYKANLFNHRPSCVDPQDHRISIPFYEPTRAKVYWTVINRKDIAIIKNFLELHPKPGDSPEDFSQYTKNFFLREKSGLLKPITQKHQETIGLFDIKEIEPHFVIPEHLRDIAYNYLGFQTYYR